MSSINSLSVDRTINICFEEILKASQNYKNSNELMEKLNQHKTVILNNTKKRLEEKENPIANKKNRTIQFNRYVITLIRIKTPWLRISSEAKSKFFDHVKDISYEICQHSIECSQKKVKIKDVCSAVEKMFPKNISSDLIMFGNETVSRYESCKIGENVNKHGKVTKTYKCGIQIPPHLLDKILRSKTKSSIAMNVPIFVAAIIEKLVIKIIEKIKVIQKDQKTIDIGNLSIAIDQVYKVI